MVSLGFLGVSYPLLAVTCIEPYWAATACPSLWEQPEQLVWASETSLHTSTYRMEAICSSSGMDNRRASGFFGWTTLDHLSGVFIDPSLRSLVLDPASPASPREVKVSLDVLRTILWRFAASGQQHCQASIEAISNTGGTSQEFPQSFAGDLQLADVATGRGLMWGYDVGSIHHLAFPRIWGKNHCWAFELVVCQDQQISTNHCSWLGQKSNTEWWKNVECHGCHGEKTNLTNQVQQVLFAHFNRIQP